MESIDFEGKERWDTILEQKNILTKKTVYFQQIMKRFHRRKVRNDVKKRNENSSFSKSCFIA